MDDEVKGAGEHPDEAEDGGAVGGEGGGGQRGVTHGREQRQ